MNIQQAQQIPLDLSAELETGHYLSPEKWGWFSVLQKQKDQHKAVQHSYRLRELPTVLPLLQSQSQKDRDNWITQAVFRKANRRKVNLAHVGACFVDLDYYNTPLNYCDPEPVLDAVLNHCLSEGIPLPSLVIDSGRGLQVKWFHEPLPRQALPRWDIVQQHLNLKFSHLGADKNARDASRVLRVVRTINQKNGKPVRVIWQQAEGFEGNAKHFVFDELADTILPFTRDDIARFRQEQLSKGKTKATSKRKTKPADVKKFHIRSHTLNSLNWSRMNDILNLHQIRSGGLGDGFRELGCFWVCNFYSLRYAKEIAAGQMNLNSEYHEFASLCRQIAPDWDMERIRDKTGNLYPLLRKHARGETVSFQGREYPPLYTPKSQHLIDVFEITDDEQRELSCIHGGVIKAEKQAERDKVRKGWKESRDDYQGKAEDRRREVIRLKSQGFKPGYIAEKLGISRQHVHRITKSLQPSDTKG